MISAIRNNAPNLIFGIGGVVFFFLKAGGFQW
jgi:hypothetical protein